jgi:hypothetical protein
MTICGTLPLITGPVFVIELETRTPMNAGTLLGGAELIPADVVQVSPQVNEAAFVTNPLNELGAGPPLNEFSCDHCELRKVT